VRVNTLSPAPQLALALLVTACGDPGPSTRQATPVAADATVPTAPAPAKSTPTLATLRDDVPMPLSRLLGRPVAEVQAELGEHTGKGMQRQSCVRFLPERTFFTCHYVTQTYADKTDNFASISVGFEDGVATEVAYTGWKRGSGEFTPEALLAAIGLTMPEPGKPSAPADKVRLWTWFNSQARLLIAGKQHRVEVSIVEDDWARSRVEVLLNHTLTPEQQARVVAPGAQPEPPAAP
jgi:hypothetical protein